MDLLERGGHPPFREFSQNLEKKIYCDMYVFSINSSIAKVSTVFPRHSLLPQESHFGIYSVGYSEFPLFDRILLSLPLFLQKIHS